MQIHLLYMTSELLDEEALRVASEEARLAILRALKDREYLSINELAEEFGKHRSTINRHLLKLLEAGLVERRETPRGEFLYSLTDKGRALVEHVEKYGLLPRVETGIVRERARRTLRSLLSLIPLAIPLILFLLGIWGLVAEARVSTLARLEWLALFTGLSLLSYAVLKRILG